MLGFKWDNIIAIMSLPSIHDAYAGFGERREPSSQAELIQKPESKAKTAETEGGERVPSDASYSRYPVKVKCPKCQSVGVTRLNSEMGAAAWVWCVLLAPFACVGISCLCLDSCRDKIHYCNRCNSVVGKKFAKVC